MLNSVNNQAFNSVFHFYFDRNDNFNCYITFNFIEFLKYYSKHPEIYDNAEFLSAYKNSLIFNFHLISKKNKILNIDSVEVVNIFNTDKLITFFLNSNTKSLSEEYQIRGTVSFEDGFYSYLEQYESDKIKAQDIKSIFDKKYLNQFKPHTPLSNYEFYSDYIDFKNKDVKVSNLYSIFERSIKSNVFEDFIDSYEQKKQFIYDGSVPITTFINGNNISSLDYKIKDKIGSTENHLNLSMFLLNNLKNRLDYKQLEYIKSIYIIDKDKRKKKVQEIKSYESVPSLQSSACEDEVFYKIEEKMLNDSDILFVSAFFDNFDIIENNEYWSNDVNLLPIYLLEILTRYNIFYLSNMNDVSLNEKWAQLTKDSLKNLDSGKYLCMISSDQMYIQNSIIENYFVLEK